MNHKLSVLAAALCAALCVSCAGGKQESASQENPVPANKKEIMDRFVAGTLDPGYAPAAFFAHFGSDCKEGEAAVQAHIKFFLESGQDILKVQFEQVVPHIDTLDAVRTDWIPEDFYAPTVEIVKEINDIAGAEVYVLPTIYNAYQVARQSLGEGRIVAAAKNNPDALLGVLTSYKNALIWLINECKKNGIEGFYMATQGGEKKFYEIPDFFETFIKPNDLEVMGECCKDTKLNILHICDWEGPFDDLTRFKDYPGQIVNTPLNIDDKPYSITEAIELFGRPVLGGFDRKGEINTATPEQVAEMTKQILANNPKGSVMVGADCTVSSAPVANVHSAVITAHKH